MNFRCFSVSLLFGVCLLGTPLTVPCAADRSSFSSTRPEDVVRQRKFARIWEERCARDVSAELLPFMDDPELCERAVRALGRLEKIGVLPELEKRRDAQNELLEKARIDLSVRANHVLDFDTAIARIKSRDLHGKTKVEFVLRNMKPSWTYEEAIAWSTKLLNDPRSYSEIPDGQDDSASMRNITMNHFKLLLVLFAATTASSFWDARPAHASLAMLTSARTPEEKARAGRLEILLKNKVQAPIAGQLSVAEQVVPFLDDSVYGLRLHAVNALGELEDPVAKEPLEKKLAQMESPHKDFQARIPTVALKWALGRIASHGLHGQAKVEAALSRLNLTWPDLVALSKKTTAAPDDVWHRNNEADDVMAYVVSLLYEMGKSGENITPIAEQLTLLPTQKAYIQAASLNTKEEVELLLRVLVDENAVGRGSPQLIDLFVILAPQTSGAVLLRLQDMKAHPELYYGMEPYPGDPNAFRQRMGFLPLLRAVAWTLDPGMIPLLREFEQCDDEDVRRNAAQARDYIERSNS